jgi:hypothetical protein
MAWFRKLTTSTILIHVFGFSIQQSIDQIDGMK